VTGRIHDEEVDTSEGVVRSLLAEQRPEWAGLQLRALSSTGTSNALWRVRGFDQRDVIVRLPRTERAERSILAEQALLPVLGRSPLAASVRVPELVHAGAPGASFPLHWVVLGWIDGDDAWTARSMAASIEDALANGLAAAVNAIATLTDLPAPQRRSGERGGPLPALLDRLNRWLDDPQWSADDLIDTAAVRRSAAQSAEVADHRPASGFVHGDLIPGNVLTVDGRLYAIIDWGGAGYGDAAQDLTPAWAIFDRRARELFRAAVDADEASWLRGRAFALEQAVGGVLYYVPRRHPLGDVMTRTLRRILADTP
jgi:aminoglycoside phosphotransferase (APT) family kinase protein